MASWQRPARVALASFAVTFGITLLYSMPNRTAPPAAPGGAPADPRAVIASSGARITLGDGSVIVADRQFAYDDGSARLVGVEVIVPAGEDRTDFRIRSGEASGVEETGEWRLSDTVTIETGDGLTGSTSEASYADATGLVGMPEPAAFEQGWMRLAGDAARYDRRRGLVHLDRRAVVELRLGTGGDAPGIRIASDNAEVDRLAGLMWFRDAVTVEAAEHRMQSDAVIVRFGADTSRLDVIELSGSARVLGRRALGEMSAETIGVAYRDGELGRIVLTGDARVLGGGTGPGQLRNLSAPHIEVDYRGGAPEQAALRGGARVELFGDRAGAPGVAIAGGSMDVALPGGGAAVDELHAQQNVTLELPAHEGTVRRIQAQALQIGRDAGEGNRTAAAVDESPAPSTTGAGGVANGAGQVAVFDGSVEFREADTPSAPAADERVMRADRMEAVLSEGLAQLMETRFIGDVTLQSGDISAEADEASYAPDAALFTLLVSDATDRTPRLDDQRGFVQAETIAIGLDGPNIEALRDVKGVLAAAEADGSSATVRPGLFAAGPPIHVVAGRFVYDAAQSLATYSDGARLWQGSTEFRGETVLLDETTGDISAEGSVRTRTTMLQNDAAVDDIVETTTEGRAGTLFFDNRSRRATYTTDALLSSPGFALGSDAIELFLHDDARTLARIEADGEVELELDARSVTGDSLAYDDGEGRYDLTGDPVRVVEEMEEGCRETTGRTVTFYASGQSISADGQSAERTASTSASCG
ncbi:MAG: hypothetical protein OXQ28_02445 [Acidobacteriota bacterium]|nr:hypothetical protein [Acidobacteriota bacterium]